MTLLRPIYHTPLDAHQGDTGRSKEEIEAELRAMLRQQRSENEAGRKGSGNDQSGVLGSIFDALVDAAISVKLPEGDISDGGWDGDGGDGGDGGGGGGD